MRNLSPDLAAAVSTSRKLGRDPGDVAVMVPARETHGVTALAAQPDVGGEAAAPRAGLRGAGPPPPEGGAVLGAGRLSSGRGLPRVSVRLQACPCLTPWGGASFHS